MRKKITFGKQSAILQADEFVFSIVTDEKMPVQLADTLNENDYISVCMVRICDDGWCIEAVHWLSASDLVEAVCDAITSVYDTDTVVSNLFSNE